MAKKIPCSSYVLWIVDRPESRSGMAKPMQIDRKSQRGLASPAPNASTSGLSATYFSRMASKSCWNGSKAALFSGCTAPAPSCFSDATRIGYDCRQGDHPAPDLTRVGSSATNVYPIKANQAGRRDRDSFCLGLHILRAPAFRKHKFRTEQLGPKDEPWLQAHTA
jgi:hypothetical protein